MTEGPEQGEPTNGTPDPWAAEPTNGTPDPWAAEPTNGAPDPWAAGVPTPPPPPPPPADDAATVALESQTAIRAGGVGGRVVAAVVGGLLLLGGIGFAATQLGGDDRTPEEAVTALFDAIADEDVLGVLATLDPGERDTLTDPIEDFFGELERLEVLDESFELTGIDGIDLEFEDLTFRAEPVRDDLVRVYLTGGTASYAVNTDELPIGDFLIDTFDRFGVEYAGIEESDSETIDPDEADDTFLVVRDTGDGWRISIGYTAAEAARVQAGKPMPAAGAGLAAIGADSPEAAVEGFLGALADLDVPGAVARLSPAEMRALHDYWPILVDDELLTPPDDVEAELTDLELRATTDGDRGQVFIDSIGLDVISEDFDGGGTLADGCVILRGDAQEALTELDMDGDRLCVEDLEELYEQAMEDMGDLDVGGFGSFDPTDVDLPELGITTTRVDGQWYVAPIRTGADLGLAGLRLLDREDLDAMVDAVEDFFDAFTGGFGGGSFEEFEDFGTELDDFEDFTDGFDDLDGFEDFEDFDDDFGLPRPGQSSDPMATRADALISEFVGFVTGDQQAAQCVLSELYSNASTTQLYELADAYELDFEPAMDTQEVFYAAMEACGA